MFKYNAINPNSALSVLSVALRLYFASFLYTLVLSIIATLTFFSISYILLTYLPPMNKYMALILSFVPSLISLIFFIPLIKRIYSVGADLPITTTEAFRGFIIHYCRMAVFIILCITASMIFPLLWIYFNPSLNQHVYFFLIAFISFIYIYIGLKVYFTAMFIVLENKGIIDALKSSLRIEHRHMWLTFCVLFIYFLAYWCVISLTSGIIIWEVLGIDIITEIFTVITLPLFLCIQIAQFFNLKRLTR
jgi:hypothetical protein